MTKLIFALAIIVVSSFVVCAQRNDGERGGRLSRQEQQPGTAPASPTQPQPSPAPSAPRERDPRETWPSNPGYIPGKASNDAEDAALKRLEAEEQRLNQESLKRESPSVDKVDKVEKIEKEKPEKPGKNHEPKRDPRDN